MLLRRALPSSLLDESDHFLWRGAELAPALGEKLSGATWNLWTFAPDFVTDDGLRRFWSVNKEWEDRPEGTWEAILGYLVERMATLGATWVVPDSMAKTTDPFFVRGEWSEYFVVGKTPYYVARDPDAAAVERAWRDGGSAAGELGLLTLAAVPSGEATADDLHRMAAQMVDLVVEAYDHSGRAVFFTAEEPASA